MKPIVVLLALLTASGAGAQELAENRLLLLRPSLQPETETTVRADGLVYARLADVERKPVRRVGSVPLALAGMVGSWVGGAAAYQLASSWADDEEVSGDATYSPAGNKAFIAGSVLGSAFAIYGLGSLKEERGELWATGLATALAALALLGGTDNAYMPYAGVLIIAPIQGMVGSIGFTVSAK